MIASSWTVHVAPEAKELIVEWLEDEGLEHVEVQSGFEAVSVDFDDIDAAFRFRMQFDEELV